MILRHFPCTLVGLIVLIYSVTVVTPGRAPIAAGSWSGVIAPEGTAKIDVKASAEITLEQENPVSSCLEVKMIFQDGSEETVDFSTTVLFLMPRLVIDCIHIYNEGSESELITVEIQRN